MKTKNDVGINKKTCHILRLNIQLLWCKIVNKKMTFLHIIYSAPGPLKYPKLYSLCYLNVTFQDTNLTNFYIQYCNSIFISYSMGANKKNIIFKERVQFFIGF